MDAKILDQVTSATVGKMYFAHKLLFQSTVQTIENIPFTPLAVIFSEDNAEYEKSGIVVKPSFTFPPLKVTEWGANYLKVTNLMNEQANYHFIILG